MFDKLKPFNQNKLDNFFFLRDQLPWYDYELLFLVDLFNPTSSCTYSLASGPGFSCYGNHQHLSSSLAERRLVNVRA